MKTMWEQAQDEQDAAMERAGRLRVTVKCLACGGGPWHLGVIEADRMVRCLGSRCYSAPWDLEKSAPFDPEAP